jgi:hypothetical protein
MKFHNYILPVFISANMFGQNTDNDFNSFDFGFSHATYSSLTFNSELNKLPLNRYHDNNKSSLQILDLQYGFGVGFFMDAFK